MGADVAGFSVEVVGAGAFEKQLTASIAKAEAGARQIAAQGGHLIEAAAKREAPVRTGSLRRSVQVFSVERVSAFTYESKTGPTIIYGRRIELGFVGMTDSLGRTFSGPPPNPYTQRGLDEARPTINALAASVWHSFLVG